MANKRATLVNSKRDRRADNPGRPPRYNPNVHPTIAKALCSKGATIVEIANAFGVCIATIWNWKVKYPEFIESCRVGFEAATDRVERSMFERAVTTSDEPVTPAAVITRAVDQDDDSPRAPRIHTISPTYQDSP